VLDLIIYYYKRNYEDGVIDLQLSCLLNYKGQPIYMFCINKVF
jgi:hypothetical protein